MNILPVELPSFVPRQHEVWISEDIGHYCRLIQSNFQASSWWVITDSRVHTLCYPRFQAAFRQEHHLVVIPEGEAHKNLASAQHIWARLEEAHADRQAVVICLGGGMISDIGGFAASCWKRGVRFIFIPTSLLGMVDASIGGKTGVDLNQGKNLLGLLSLPALVISDTSWLQTLAERELKAGFAECLKHGLVADETYWRRLSETPFAEQAWEFVVYRSQIIKSEIVRTDPDEQWLRKVLNFGHSMGHALESLCLELNLSLLHGEAVAWGMWMEVSISARMGLLSPENARAIQANLESWGFTQPLPDFREESIVNKFIYYLRQDKKNRSETIRMSLLLKAGKAEVDQEVGLSMIREVLGEYHARFRS